MVVHLIHAHAAQVAVAGGGGSRDVAHPTRDVCPGLGMGHESRALDIGVVLLGVIHVHDARVAESRHRVHTTYLDVSILHCVHATIICLP